METLTLEQQEQNRQAVILEVTLCWMDSELWQLSITTSGASAKPA